MKRWAQRLLFLAVFGSVGWAPLSVIVFYVLAKLFALAALIDQTETQFFTCKSRESILFIFCLQLRLSWGSALAS